MRLIFFMKGWLSELTHNWETLALFWCFLSIYLVASKLILNRFIGIFLGVKSRPINILFIDRGNV